MAGKSARTCGYRGEVNAQALLAERDWTDIERRPPGEAGSDLRATDPHGQRWSVEVKNTVAYQPKYWRQCVHNAKKDKLPPMLMWYAKDHTKQWHIKRNRDGRLGWEVWG